MQITQFWWRIVKPLSLTAVLLTGGAWATDKYRVEIAQATTGCLPVTAVLVDKHNLYPSRGQLFSYRSQSAEPYFAAGSTFNKIAAALPGDMVEITPRQVKISHREGGTTEYALDARRMLTYAQMSPLDITKTLLIPKGKIFALGTLSSSFDSRYWGLVDNGQVKGVGYALF
ncbi:S26 family signal peptidase [uncultured Photobacterium sp.]|uniref:S26 family signal peptidase n=1 Tax=uncultured Photobacterium sp. TaxID=173973 RepID=UPI00260913F7|nr:S26 family signal peptidase [uncultured Photobacterium sp.]